MNFKQQLSNYVIGNLQTSDLPAIALVGVEEGLNSQSLAILTSLTANDNTFEIDYYFKKALDELGIKLPDVNSAAMDIIHYYSNLIIEKQIDEFTGVEKIVRDVLNKTDIFTTSDKYVYDNIGFEKIYSLYDTCCELQNALNPWDTEKTNLELIKDIKEQIIIEIGKWIGEKNNNR